VAKTTSSLLTVDAVGVVVIGRNEGERLKVCLRSLKGQAERVVYVDSGSTDGSLECAAASGAEVVALERPFTAARARNAGLERLHTRNPEIPFVQFLDGDCELRPGWLQVGAAALASDSGLAVVCGRLRERFPEASVYNQLCDLEWDVPAGPAEASGGIAMMRVAALAEVQGFAPELIAGEEPDLCFRLRQRGHRILRLGDEMALHDAALLRFGQWWRRARRAGHAYAEGAARHRHEPGRFWQRESRRIVFWGLVLPSLAFGLCPLTIGLSLALLAGYPALGWRIYRSSRKRGRSPTDARLYAQYCVLGKIPEGLGMAEYWLRHFFKSPSAIIEYKARKR
jgi:GT2 family glycosyltransferase